jgi:hypothetical protein
MWPEIACCTFTPSTTTPITKTTKAMSTVTLKMTDELTEQEVVRTIDISVLFVNNDNALSGWEGDIIAPVERQRNLLKRWISERGNQQHNTILTLNSWEIN